MNPIKIESTVAAEEINHIINGISINEDLTIAYEEYQDRSTYTFSLNKKEELDSFLLDSLTTFVEEIILKFYSEEIILDNLDKKIGLIDNNNKEEIVRDVKEVLKSKSLFIKEKKEIRKELIDFLLENNSLMIDGYLNFRSKSFRELVAKAIELVLGEFQLEVEYNEFVETLKLLIESQTSEVELVNIVFKDNKYELLDSEFNPINNDHISIALAGIDEDNANKEDVLLSTIIALSPKNVVIHLGDRKKSDLIYILEEVFEDRIEICRRCKYCGNN